MTLHYPTEYSDHKGREKTTIITDGKGMKLLLRGKEFSTTDFWNLYPSKDRFEDLSDLFEFTKDGSLANYQLKVTMPVFVIDEAEKEIAAMLEFTMNDCQISINISGKTYPLGRPNFEYGLSPQFTKLPGIKYIRCCNNCAFSEYSPYGSDDYGDLLCFKNSKEAWNKIGYQGLKDKENWNKLIIEKTQEAFWCEEFALKTFF